MTVHVQLEFTPNPDTLKYTVSRPLLERGAASFDDAAEAAAEAPAAPTPTLTPTLGPRLPATPAADAGPAASAAETAFRFEHDGNTSAFYWVDQGFGYALAGNLPRAELLALATLVYRSL